jgi:uncharacterized protein YndB with AHSA1/START domain
MAESSARTSHPPNATGAELVLTRVFEAPRDLVFEVWTEPEHLERWQGAPQGFTVTSHEVDLRPGGAFRICMRSPEGVDHWLQGVYREVIKPARLVFTHAWLDAQGNTGPETLVTITFTELGGKTELTLRQTGFQSAGSHDGHRGGWISTLDRMDAYIVTVSRSNQS